MKVTFRTTVEQAIQNLENLGFSWVSVVQGYTEVRAVTGFASGMMISRVLADESRTDTERSKIYHDLKTSAPELDLLSLGKLLCETATPKTDEQDLLMQMSYGDGLPDPLTAALSILDLATKLDGVAEYNAAIAAESLSYLGDISPHILWPVMVSTVLRAASGSATLELDLSEDAQEHLDANEVGSVLEYADKYWRDTSNGLAATARMLGRLLGNLAPLDGKLGAEYWRAQSRQQLRQVMMLNGSGAPNKAKGDSLESLAESLLALEGGGLEVLEKNLRTPTCEVDLVAANHLSGPFWQALNSPLVMIECKNWKKRVGVAALRAFETKIRDRGRLCRIGVFISIAGFTGPFLARLREFQARQDGVVFCVDGDDLTELLEQGLSMSEWLRMEGMKRAL